MKISDQFLSDLKKQLEGDMSKYAALIEQTRGALFVLGHIEKNKEQEELSIADLEKIAGGTVEAIEPADAPHS
jgi:hypothetical protein